MKPILISISPNVERDDRQLAWSTLWRSPADTRPDVRAKLHHKLGRNVELTSSGRGALYSLLKALPLSTGQEVIVQAFTCIAVPAAVCWAGGTVRFVDISFTTLNFDLVALERSITSSTRAIIVQHTFGIPAPIDEIKALAQPRGILVIEDLAHSFGGQIGHRPIGQLGDAAILSFGRDKMISCVFGGAVASDDTELLKRVAADQKNFSLPPRWWVRQQMWHPLIMSVVKPLYYTGGLGRLVLLAAQKLGFLSKAVTKEERRGNTPPHLRWQFPGELSILLAHQLDKLDRYNHRRRQIVERYLQAFPEQAVAIPRDPIPPLLRFPITVDRPQKVLAQARSHSIMLGDWYNQPIVPTDHQTAQKMGYVMGACPVAETVARSIINLPVLPTMTDEDIERVIAFMKSL